MTPFFWVELSFSINETSNGILLAGHTCLLPANSVFGLRLEVETYQMESLMKIWCHV